MDISKGDNRFAHYTHIESAAARRSCPGQNVGQAILPAAAILGGFFDLRTNLQGSESPYRFQQ
jgi:hypothetical protein